MRTDGCRLAQALLAAGALALSGCGGHDEISVAEAKEKLAVDCEQGPQIDALRAAINFGTTRLEVTQSIGVVR